MMSCRSSPFTFFLSSLGIFLSSLLLPPSPLLLLLLLLLLLFFSDLEFALTLSIDWVALSFVQKPEDILELRALAGPKLKVIVEFHS